MFSDELFALLCHYFDLISIDDIYDMIQCGVLGFCIFNSLPTSSLSRMVSSGLLRRVALVRTDVSEEPGASFIRVTKICALGTTQAATSNRRIAACVVPSAPIFVTDEGGARFLRNVGSYKSHTA
jgi:hypothetical protein